MYFIYTITIEKEVKSKKIQYYFVEENKQIIFEKHLYIEIKNGKIRLKWKSVSIMAAKLARELQKYPLSRRKTSKP